MARISTYQPPIAANQVSGPKPPFEVPKRLNPPQRVRTITLPADLAYMTRIPGGVLVALNKTGKFLQAYNEKGQAIWGSGCKTFHPNSREEICQVVPAGNHYTWVMTNIESEGAYFTRIIDTAAGCLEQSTYWGDQPFYLAPWPRANLVIKANADLSVDLFFSHDMTKCHTFPVEHGRKICALTAADELVIAIQTHSFDAYLLVYNINGELLHPAIKIDARYGEPVQVIYDQSRELILAATNKGYIMAGELGENAARRVAFGLEGQGKIRLKIIGDLLFAVAPGNYHCKLTALDLNKLQEKWIFPAMGEIEGYSLPLDFEVQGQRQLLVTSGDGKLLALDSQTGVPNLPPIPINAWQAFQPVPLGEDHFVVPAAAPGRRVEEKPTRTLAVYKWG